MSLRHVSHSALRKGRKSANIHTTVAWHYPNRTAVAKWRHISPPQSVWHTPKARWRQAKLCCEYAPMLYERLRIFISSSMEELAPERIAIRTTLSQLNLDGWIFEMDAGARPQGIQQTYRQQIDDSDLYIGILWRKCGEYTIDEFEYAKGKHKDCLIYEKRTDIEGQRDQKLQEFLAEIGKVEGEITVRWFKSLEELSEGVKEDVTRWQAQKIRELRELNVRRESSPVKIDERRDLKILLGNVRRFWVEGVLDRSLENQRLLEIGKDTKPEAVQNRGRPSSNFRTKAAVSCLLAREFSMYLRMSNTPFLFWVNRGPARRRPCSPWFANSLSVLKRMIPNPFQWFFIYLRGLLQGSLCSSGWSMS